MYPAGGVVYHGRQRVYVRRFQFAEAAILQYHGRQRVVGPARQGLQNLCVGRVSRLRLLQRFQFPLREQYLAELPRRGDIEFLARLLMDFSDKGVYLSSCFLRHAPEEFAVKRHAVEFHVGQNADQGHFHPAKKAFQILLFQGRLKDLPEPPGDIRVLARILAHPPDGHPVHGYPVLTLADEVRGRHLAVVQVVAGEGVDIVPGARGIQQPGGDHRVEVGAEQIDAVPPEHDHVVLQVLPDLGDAAVLEDGPERIQGRSPVGQPRRIRTHHGQVAGLTLLPGEGDAHQFRAHRLFTRRFRVDGE